MHPPTGTRGGFTLAEAAVTIALLALTLTVLLQSLEASKFQAAHTRDQKIARELALGTLGQIEAGLWQDEIEFTRSGNYAEEGHPSFWFELAIGDEAFSDAPDPDPNAPFDNWAHREQLRLDREAALSDDALDEEEEVSEPFEKLRIRITFPRYGELSSELSLERWVPWEQVYGEDEEAAQEEGAAGDAGAGGADPGGAADTGGGGGG